MTSQSAPIRVLVVEDDLIAAEAHRTYVERLPGFAVAGVARTFQEAVRALSTVTDGTAPYDRAPIDLVLLDMNLPDGHGLDLLRQLRAIGLTLDVIAVTSARDVDVVRAAVSQGVVAYLLKPFSFAMFAAKLEQYAAFRATLADGGAVDQHTVDAVFQAMRPATQTDTLPKGLSAATLDLVRKTLGDAAAPLSAGEIGELIGASRVTVRRYLEHLCEQGTVMRGSRYGGAGRPHVEYSLRS